MMDRMKNIKEKRNKKRKEKEMEANVGNVVKYSE